MTPEQVHRRGRDGRAARPRRRRLRHRRKWRVVPEGARATASSSSATATRATRARSRTARSWRATPTAVLEGMIIGAYAVGAHEGFIYVRDEYPLAVVNLTQRDRAGARSTGLLGDEHPRHRLRLRPQHLARRRRLRLRRVVGADALGRGQGRRAARQVRPRHRQGLFDLPTVLNNVETWADVGAHHRPAAPTGSPRIGHREVEGHQGVLAGRQGQEHRPDRGADGDDAARRSSTTSAAASSTTGRSRRCRPAGRRAAACPRALLDLPVDFEKLTEAGLDDGLGRHDRHGRPHLHGRRRPLLPQFLTEESCGKCVPCREGLHADAGDLRRPGRGQRPSRATSSASRSWRPGMQLGSLCELGKSAPNPVLSTLRYFRDEYEAHIHAQACPAGICRDLTAYEIVPELCNGCHLCFKACPTEAITGEVKKLHVIHQEKCISCGACFDVCPTRGDEVLPETRAGSAKEACVMRRATADRGPGSGVRGPGQPTRRRHGDDDDRREERVQVRGGGDRCSRRRAPAGVHDPDALPPRGARAVGRLPAVPRRRHQAGLGRLVQAGRLLHVPGRGRPHRPDRHRARRRAPARSCSTSCSPAARRRR